MAKKHGMEGSVEYKAWAEAKQRCHNPSNEKFKWYGARGISVCDEWRNDFVAFYKHIGPRPAGFELDRINNDAGYEPGNVRWASKTENVRNRRNTVKVLYKGSLVTLEEYAKAEGVSYSTAWSRAKYYPHMISGVAPRTGARNGNTKLTDEQVRQVRASSDSTKSLQMMYGVSRGLIQGIRSGKLRRAA